MTCFPEAGINTLSLNAAQTKYNLQVSSSHGNVADAFSRALIGDGKFVFLDAYRCYVSLKVGPLHLVRCLARSRTLEQWTSSSIQGRLMYIVALSESYCLDSIIVFAQ